MIKGIYVDKSKDFTGYTLLPEVFPYLGDIVFNYNWLITDMEGAHETDIFFYRDGDWGSYLLDGKSLVEHLSQHPIQFIWGALSAIPKKHQLTKEELLQMRMPLSDDNGTGMAYTVPLSIQHPLAEIEILCIDSSAFAVKAISSIDLDAFYSIDHARCLAEVLKTWPCNRP